MPLTTSSVLLQRLSIICLIWVLPFHGALAQVGPATTASVPEQSFEAFWHAFRDHYAFFPQKQVDWEATYATYRPQVSAQTTDSELVAIFRQMVEPLHDGHITIARGETMLYKGESTRNSFKQIFKSVQPQFWQVAHQQLQAAGFAPVQASGPVFKEKPLLYTTRTATVGYLHLTRFFAEAKGVMGTAAQEKRDAKLLEKHVSKALAQMADCQVLLIDVRDNGGGHSGYELAGRFSDQRVLANYKAIRQAGSYEQFGEPQAFYLTPAKGPRFTGSVVLLTSDQTASAAEDFTLALAQRPQVVRVGTATKGMLSDMYGTRLPNGLEITLSNQRYTTPQGQVLEDVGVAPTVFVENTLPDLERQHDAVLAQALKEARKLTR
ncbi:S41 family peptidase [Hymenobacter norwichensis]|uniref:S41 family peptidase n=1 Tax=Hymenobacter norwichensis TaxID=223903 RepID=UPI0003B4013D|nr:S41 family peptidase [Hymenobacter norwichensis]